MARKRTYLECEARGLVVEPLDGDGEDGRAERLADLRGGRPAHEVVDGPEVAPLHLVLLRLGPGLAHHLGLRAALPLPRHPRLRRRRLSFDEKPKTFSERKRGEFGGDSGPILVFQRICCPFPPFGWAKTGTAAGAGGLGSKSRIRSRVLALSCHGTCPLQERNLT